MAKSASVWNNPIRLLGMTKMVLEFLSNYGDVASLVIRVFLGALMVIHGYPKVFSKEQRSQMIPAMKSMGVPRIAYELVAILEFFGGLALVFGLLTRLAAMLFTIEMLGTMILYNTKLYKAPMPRGMLEAGFKATHGYMSGWELDTTVLASMVALMVLGAGTYSLDLLLGIGI